MRSQRTESGTRLAAPKERAPEALKDLYLNTVRLLERLHRQFLDVVETELNRLNVEDINNVQSLILFHIGRDNLTVGELQTRGYYLGSNVSYNVRKLVETGYLVQEQSVHDRRSSRVFLSDKGLTLYDQLNDMFDNQVRQLRGVASAKDLDSATATFKRLGGFWHNLGWLRGRSRRRALTRAVGPVRH